MAYILNIKKLRLQMNKKVGNVCAHSGPSSSVSCSLYFSSDSDFNSLPATTQLLMLSCAPHRKESQYFSRVSTGYLFSPTGESSFAFSTLFDQAILQKFQTIFFHHKYLKSTFRFLEFF